MPRYHVGEKVKWTLSENENVPKEADGMRERGEATAAAERWGVVEDVLLSDPGNDSATIPEHFRDVCARASEDNPVYGIIAGSGRHGIVFVPETQVIEVDPSMKEEPQRAEVHF
eukprot:ANDGO_07589.mRNA.1 hypothetical protein